MVEAMDVPAVVATAVAATNFRLVLAGSLWKASWNAPWNEIVLCGMPICPKCVLATRVQDKAGKKYHLLHPFMDAL